MRSRPLSQHTCDTALISRSRRRWSYLLLSVGLFSMTTPSAQLLSDAFAVVPTKRTPTRLWATTLPDIGTMRAGEMRHELESYGVSTKSFLEKTELIEALEKARAAGSQPINGSSRTKAATVENTKQDTTTKQQQQANGKTQDNRAARIKKEMEKVSKMNVSELKKDLKERGVSTTAFLEKSDFVRALAEAIVDGVQNVNRESANGASSPPPPPPPPQEPYDPSYRDVVVQKMNARDPRLLQGTVIDIPLITR